MPRKKRGIASINVTLRRVRITIVAVEKQCVTYFECVPVASVIQHALNMRGLLLYHISPHYLISGTIFGEKVIEHKMFVVILCTTFV